MERIRLLLLKYYVDKASREEIAEMLLWLQEHGTNEQLLQEVWETHSSDAPAAELKDLWSRIELETLPAQESRPVLLLRRGWWAAAAAVVLLTVGAWLLFSPHRDNRVAAKQTAAPVPDVAPGKSGAVLTLADGKQVVLDSMGNGLVAVQNGSKVVLQNGRLSYDDVSQDRAPLVYNTMSTPRGRQFSIVLPDGSRVWLNAASSIRYPTMFTGTERKVELTGEAYFEVAKDRNRPFIVHTVTTETEVLGTSFNVSAYEEDGVVRTTLLDGSVRTGGQEGKVLLSPGEQAQLKVGEKLKVDHHANPDQVLAWKNGAFNFQNADLHEVMRQLARWYDLDVIYEKGVPNVSFGGEISRNVPLSDLLKGLKGMDVHFRIEEGHRLIVMP